MFFSRLESDILDLYNEMDAQTFSKTELTDACEDVAISTGPDVRAQYPKL